MTKKEILDQITADLESAEFSYFGKDESGIEAYQAPLGRNDYHAEGWESEGEIGGFFVHNGVKVNFAVIDGKVVERA